MKDILPTEQELKDYNFAELALYIELLNTLEKEKEEENNG